MTLIKLDSGNLMNLEAVAYVDAEKGQAYFKQPVIRRESDFSTEKLFAIKATAADINRILEAMGALAPADADADIHTDSDGSQYQIMTGRELIAGLAEDAMQDEQLGSSYRNALAIVPSRKYRAYLDRNAGGLNGDWEEV